MMTPSFPIHIPKHIPNLYYLCNNFPPTNKMMNATNDVKMTGIPPSFNSILDKQNLCCITLNTLNTSHHIKVSNDITLGRKLNYMSYISSLKKYPFWKTIPFENWRLKESWPKNKAPNPYKWLNKTKRFIHTNSEIQNKYEIIFLRSSVS